jgi:hypothetical protein
MSSFQIPKNICKKIDSKFRDFFWGFMDTQKKKKIFIPRPGPFSANQNHQVALALEDPLS